MGVCKAICSLVALLIVAVLLIMFVDPVQRGAIFLASQNLDAGSVALSKFGWAIFFLNVIRCKGDAKGCAYNKVFVNWVEVRQGGFRTEAACRASHPPARS